MIASKTKIVDIHSLTKVITNVNEVFGGQIWWRGNPDTSYKLQPSVFRPRNDDSGYKYEANINSRFMQKAPALRQNVPNDEDWFAWLFLMQHYGHPTRLLDWTESPLVACYFAVNSEKEKIDDIDGALFAISPYRLNFYQADTYGLLDSQSNIAYNMAQRAFRNYNYPSPNVIAILPNLIDARMIAQLSVFTIHDNNIPLEENSDSSDFLVKFEIPSITKHLIREQLKHAGIRPSSLFPDLEHLSKELKDIKSFKDTSSLEKIDVTKLE